MTRIFAALLALTTVAACGDRNDNYEASVTRTCGGTQSPFLEGQSHPVRCGPQMTSPHYGGF